MKTLIKKELTLLLGSPVVMFFITAFLLSSGLMLWLFPGSYNILDAGYATLYNFFRLATILFIILIPALTMRSFSDEIKSKNLDVFRTRPLHLSMLYYAKAVTLGLIILLVLVSTLIYIFTINALSVPTGNIDVNEIAASYLYLLLLAFVFISIGLFASSLTKNQIIAFIVSVFLNIMVFYGFDLLASLFASLQTQGIILAASLSSRSTLMQKGVFYISDLLWIISYIILFGTLSAYALSLKNKRSIKSLLIKLSFVAVLIITACTLPSFKFDFTADKRYTISDYTIKELSYIKNNHKNIQVNVYLEGDLNTGFIRLQDATKDMLSVFSQHSGQHISYQFINPHNLYYKPEEIYSKMQNLGMKGIMLNEIDREGKSSRKIIYPYAQICSEKDTLQVNLLKNIAGYTAEENLNASIENLEFEFIDAIHLFNKSEPEAIAFIEGHNEIPRAYVYDAEELLSKYYFVNRGEIGKEVSVLDEFKVVIIAGPQKQFSEAEKYVLDQYIMSGGKVLWLIDGVYLSTTDLEEKGESASMKNNTNLDDMLFTYGVRINPNLIQDTQCTSIYLTSGNEADNNSYVQQPWYYSLLLIPSDNHPISKNISLIKALFLSSIDITNQNPDIEKSVLLTSSANSHLVEVPEMISLDLSNIEVNRKHFNQSFLPVAVALRGKFGSAFENRLIPDSIILNGHEFKNKSVTDTKMIVMSSSDVIRNDIAGHEGESHVLPMGYDKTSSRQFGNRNFIVNAVNWLASDEGLFALRNKHQKIRLLDKQSIFINRNYYVALNIILPLLISLLTVGIFYIYRRWRYTR